jgi:hypothetical protein
MQAGLQNFDVNREAYRTAVEHKSAKRLKRE